VKAAILGVMIFAGAGVLFAQEAVIREISGTVELKASGAADWSPARRGQEVGRNTVISTGFRSTALIVLGNSTILVQPLTRLSVEELVRSGGGERVSLNLRAGRVRADVSPPLNGTTEFTVRSPTATASVRGTSFEFDGIRLRVDQGRVHMSGGDRSGTYVGAGREVAMDLETGRTPGVAEAAREALAPPLPAGADNAQKIKAELLPNVEIGFDWDHD
jgi:hypothetical protein